MLCNVLIVYICLSAECDVSQDTLTRTDAPVNVKPQQTKAKKQRSGKTGKAKIQ